MYTMMELLNLAIPNAVDIVAVEAKKIVGSKYTLSYYYTEHPDSTTLPSVQIIIRIEHSESKTYVSSYGCISDAQQKQFLCWFAKHSMEFSDMKFAAQETLKKEFSDMLKTSKV